MCTRKAITKKREKSRAIGRQVRPGPVRRVKCAAADKPAAPPTVMPNMAMEMATKAKWYHMVTLKIRVSRISSISVDNVTRKRPA